MIFLFDGWVRYVSIVTKLQAYLKEATSFKIQEASLLIWGTLTDRHGCRLIMLSGIRMCLMPRDRTTKVCESLTCYLIIGIIM
jgi:hypothetical protein